MLCYFIDIICICKEIGVCVSKIVKYVLLFFSSFLCTVLEHIDHVVRMSVSGYRG